MPVSRPDGDPLLPAPLLIVEDESLMQLRLRRILGEVGYHDDMLSCAGSIAEAEALLATQPFAFVLVDVGLPDGNGIDLIRDLHERDAALPLLVISAWSTEEVIVTALQAGATGYLLKERDDVEIALSIRSALRGGAPIDPFVARRILALLAPPAVPAPVICISQGTLTPRETEILTMVGKGLTNREISGALSLSRLTVECHVKNIYKKLSVHSRTEALFEARQRGLLP
ncbi:DNA-binding response regulator [Burkholderia sp. WAC0059]|uniref:response regulator n=1 Tax=Burkholderia sp. WAC0059 TaxID=2066022 RepID=UPI000C7F56F9|nr:response regulator transcription factor [Burkholderia sp. WAC0059]PLZ00631.1 DNA-binding response regulator [Burkholderia sp. WAC0059]